MNKQDYLDFINYCAGRIGFKPKSKFEIFEGKVKIWEQEGGYYSPGLSIGPCVDFTDWFEKKYQIYEEEDSREDAHKGFGRWFIPGKFRITVEKL